MAQLFIGNNVEKYNKMIFKLCKQSESDKT